VQSPEAASSAVPDQATDATPEVSAEELRRNAAAEKLLASAFGQVISLLMRAPQYKARTLADIERLVVPAVVTGQYSVAEVQSKQNGLVAPVAVALWASVSKAVDERLSRESDMEVRLDPPEWKSGENIWVVEALGEPRVIESVMKRLAQKKWAGKTVKLRARGKDGKPAVGVLHAESADGQKRPEAELVPEHA
jgi:cytolysin-activating lysine-acyltransferase